MEIVPYTKYRQLGGSLNHLEYQKLNEIRAYRRQDLKLPDSYEDIEQFISKVLTIKKRDTIKDINWAIAEAIMLTGDGTRLKEFLKRLRDGAPIPVASNTYSVGEPQVPKSDTAAQVGKPVINPSEQLLGTFPDDTLISVTDTEVALTASEELTKFRKRGVLKIDLTKLKETERAYVFHRCINMPLYVTNGVSAIEIAIQLLQTYPELIKSKLNGKSVRDTFLEGYKALKSSEEADPNLHNHYKFFKELAAKTNERFTRVNTQEAIPVKLGKLPEEQVVIDGTKMNKDMYGRLEFFLTMAVSGSGKRLRENLLTRVQAWSTDLSSERELREDLFPDWEKEDFVRFLGHLTKLQALPQGDPAEIKKLTQAEARKAFLSDLITQVSAEKTL